MNTVKPETTPALVLARLRAEADKLGRPDKRHATLDRMVEACDAIESGAAAGAVRKAGATDTSLRAAYEAHYKRPGVRVKPPRIEEYVRARRVLDQAENHCSTWSGPISATIRGERHGMLLYVRLREEAQHSPRTAKPSKHLSVFDNLDKVDDMTVRQRLLFALEEGWAAKRELELLRKGLMTVQGVSLHALASTAEGAAAAAPGVSEVTPLNRLNDADRAKLDELLNLLRNNARLAGFNLLFDGSRVKEKSTRETLVDKAMIEALLRAIGGDATNGATPT